MANQQSLPPTPPLTKEGFGATTWQQWFEIVRRRLSEAYGPGNLPPQDQPVPGSLAELDTVQGSVQDLARELEGTVTVPMAYLFELAELVERKNAPSGYPGLTVTLQIQLFNAAGTVETALETVATAAQTYTFPDLSGTVALLLQDAQFAKLGCNGKAPQASVALPADATDLPTVITLANAIKAALVANGIGS